ncbi:MAG: hypothetical protein EZS28_047482 [Streblomastix strix]|uniref:Uncharacterized protein n=1 Tax=Streblomastix strix TaxID=222440 RepID=A0A5J4THD8_9EUKA|nr:MAG: hypothetical protein EZS28_047482 [Streblomastix strix]
MFNLYQLVQHSILIYLWIQLQLCQQLWLNLYFKDDEQDKFHKQTSAKHGLILDTELHLIITTKPPACSYTAVTDVCERVPPDIEIDPLDLDFTIAIPKELPPNAITAALALLAGLSGKDTSQIDFYTEELSEEQVVEAGQRARAATDLVTQRKQPKHNNPPAQPMLAKNQVLADPKTRQLQQCRLLQENVMQIVKLNWITMNRMKLELKIVIILKI